MAKNIARERRCEASITKSLLVVQSVSLGPLTRENLAGLDRFEERNFFLVKELLNPNVRMLFALTEGYDKELVDYSIRYASMSLGMRLDDVLERLEIVSVPSSKEGLSKSLLNNKYILNEIRMWIGKTKVELVPWCVTPYEEELASALGAEVYGSTKSGINLNNKSLARGFLCSNHFKVPEGTQNIYSKQSALKAMQSIMKASENSRFVLKINNEDGGNGVAFINLDVVTGNINSQIIGKNISESRFFEELALQGGVVEVFIEDEHTAFPSVKMEIDSDGGVRCLATHEQATSGGMFLGSQFPASKHYRSRITEIGYEVAISACRLGVQGYLSIDFVATSSALEEFWDLNILEVNVRSTATTHPYFWTKLLTDSSYDVKSGTLRTNSGKSVVYQAVEYFSKPTFNHICFEDIQKAICADGINTNDEGFGVWLHMTATLKSHKKFGATLIASTESELESLRTKLNRTLDKLTVKPACTT